MIGGGNDKSGIASMLKVSAFSVKLGGFKEGDSKPFGPLASFNGDKIFLECFYFVIH